MKKKNMLLMVALGLFIAMLAIFVITFINSWPYVFGLKSYKMYANVTATNDTFAWELVKDGKDLTFGKIRVPGGASRKIVVNNSYSFPIVMKVYVEGTIEDMLSYEKDVIVAGGEGKEIRFSVWMPENTSLGYYDGFVKVKLVPAQ